MTRHFDYCPSASVHFQGRLAWWLLAFLHSEHLCPNNAGKEGATFTCSKALDIFTIGLGVLFAGQRSEIITYDICFCKLHKIFNWGDFMEL